MPPHPYAQPLPAVLVVVWALSVMGSSPSKNCQFPASAAVEVALALVMAVETAAPRFSSARRARTSASVRLGLHACVVCQCA